MRKLSVVVLLAAALPLCAAAPKAKKPDFEKRISALMAKMTLEEKLGQLQQLDGEANGNYRPEHLELARKGLLGSTLNVRGAKRVNELQKAALESRLKIPILFAFDVIHGYRTVFPIPLGETASFDPQSAELNAAVAAKETRAAGVHWTFAPMVDIARDPRWGRMAEGSGEDPYLGAVMARARVRGFQGGDYSASDKVAACAKHWAAYGTAEAGRDYNTGDVSARTLYETYFPPFKAALDEGAATFMSAFEALNGVPCTGNPWLLRDILKKDWRFDGFVVSDYESVKELVKHGVAQDEPAAAALALKSGVDMEMVSRAYKSAAELVKKKQIPMSVVDEAVRRVLRVKFRAGIFERPYADEKTDAAVVPVSGEKRQAAYDAALKSFVLLKNDNKTLPLPKTVKTLLLVGALADDKAALLGSWIGDGQAEDAVSILEGVKARAQEAGAELIYARGAGPNPSEKDDVSDAAEAAQEADYIVAVVGEDPFMSGEAASRTDLGLPGRQQELLKALAAADKPLAVVILSGRPVEINWLAENVPAIMQIWFPGTMGGPALASALFGDRQVAGKLPVSWPRAVGQLPLYYNHLNTGRPADPNNKYTSKYLDVPNTPLFPFGYGLTYQDFTLSGLELSASTITARGSVTIAAALRNNGAVRADEVVQVYVQDVVASVARPVRELKAFRRVSVEPGETVKAEFTLGPDELGFYGADLKYRVEPGEFRVWVSTSSEGGLGGSFHVVR